MEHRYLVIDEPANFANGDVFSSIHLTLEEANSKAEWQWSYLSNHDKKKRHIYVCIVTREDLSPDAIDEDGEIDWNGFHSCDSKDGYFDSNKI